jgi:hypothetical protein
MKKKYETSYYQEAKRAEIAEMLTIAQKLTDSGYGDIWFVPEDEETRKEVKIIK